MTVTNPLPLWLIALIPFLPGIWLGARALIRFTARERRLELLLAPAVGIAAWLVLVHMGGRLSGSFVTGLSVGTLTAGISGYLAWFTKARGVPVTGPVGFPWSMWVGAAGAILLITPMALGWAFHDELFFTGHYSIAAELQRDIYPPRHLTFPAFELRYHYGFNILVAAATGLTRCSLTMAIDGLTLLFFGYTWCLLFVLGEKLVGWQWGSVVAAMVLLGGGIPFFCSPEQAPLAWNLLGLCQVDSATINPPMVSYFFQHPWTLGLPLAVSMLLLAQQEDRNPLWYFALAVLSLALSLSQIVLFVTISASIAGASFIRRGKLSWQTGAIVTAVLITASIIATQWGGVFAPAPDNLGGDLVFHPGIADSIDGSLRWHLITFGLLLPLGVAGLVLCPQQSLIYILLTAGSLTVLNSVRHAHSWDITKFATITALSLSIAAVFALKKIWDRGTRGRSFVSLILFLTVLPGLLFCATFAVQSKGIPGALFHRSPQVLDDHDSAAVEWLRERANPEDVVYRRFPEVSGYAQQGGLAPAWVDRMVVRHGFSSIRLQRRIAVIRTWPDDIRIYRQEGIRYLVLIPGEKLPNQLADSWESSGQAKTVATFGPLRIIDLSPD
jgi:hypothetical protein